MAEKIMILNAIAILLIFVSFVIEIKTTIHLNKLEKKIQSLEQTFQNFNNTLDYKLEPAERKPKKNKLKIIKY